MPHIARLTCTFSAWSLLPRRHYWTNKTKTAKRFHKSCCLLFTEVRLPILHVHGKLQKKEKSRYTA